MGWVSRGRGNYALGRDEQNAVVILLKRSETQGWRQKYSDRMYLKY
jgi:hypothetical protein